MTQLEMNDYRIVLQNKRAELNYGNRSRGVLAIEAAGDEMDQTQGALERDLAIGGFDRNARLLRDVRSALGRVGDGTFGICLDCEVDVSRKRLAAVPWAELCIRCQEAADNEADGSPDASQISMAEAA